MLQVGHRMSGAELVDFQERASHHLSFSLTSACPLRCRHCMVATVGANESRNVTLTTEQAAAYAHEMPVLAAEGITHISFTGGEPLLVAELVALLSEAAREAGIECCVVTACHWARTPERAREVLAALPAITSWHLSMDRYHAEFLRLENVAHAARAAVAAGRRTVVRAAVPRPPTDADEELLRELIASLPADVQLAVQPVTRVGRAQQLPMAETDRLHDEGALAWVPCTSTGPLVRPDGEMRPCCGGLADGDTEHGFSRPRADKGLVAAYRAWRDDPLLRLVRAIGFAPVIAWVRDAEGQLPDDGRVPAHPCDQCLWLWRQPGAAHAVSQRLRQPEVLRKIDAVHDAVFVTH